MFAPCVTIKAFFPATESRNPGDMTNTSPTADRGGLQTVKNFLCHVRIFTKLNANLKLFKFRQNDQDRTLASCGDLSVSQSQNLTGKSAQKPDSTGEKDREA